MDSVAATCVVLIPIYKEMLTPMELASFQQVLQVLSLRKIALVAPKSLNVINYQKWANIEIYRFEDQYFENIKGYNKLLTSVHFYKRFEAFDYLLIYQLDAWVFEDQLDLWTSKDYDYLGAPWLEKPASKSGFNLGFLLKNKVGNGGFSLRKVSSFIRVLSKWQGFCHFLSKNEDFIFSIIIPRLAQFKIPDAQIAIAFSFESNPAKAFQLNQGKLPFGCHAWEKFDRSFWEPFISVSNEKK